METSISQRQSDPEDNGTSTEFGSCGRMHGIGDLRKVCVGLGESAGVVTPRTGRGDEDEDDDG